MINISDKITDEIKEQHWEWFKSKILSKNLEFSSLNEEDIKAFSFIFTGKFDSFNDDISLNEVLSSIKKEDSLFIKTNIILGTNLNNYTTFLEENIDVKKLKKFKTWFNYENFYPDKKKSLNWNRQLFLVKLDVKTCPYCNRQYITSYKDKTMKNQGDLDHFYPKSRYPWLSLSLYNFVPSCTTCNKLKLAFTTPILHPFSDYDEEKIKFSLNYSNYEELVGLNMDFSISVNPLNEDDKLAQNSIVMFKLNEIYDVHKNSVKDILYKISIYNSSQIDEILENYPNLFINKKDFFKLCFGSSIFDEDLSSEPLLKLKRDLLKTFNVLE